MVRPIFCHFYDISSFVILNSCCAPAPHPPSPNQVLPLPSVSTAMAPSASTTSMVFYSENGASYTLPFFWYIVHPPELMLCPCPSPSLPHPSFAIAKCVDGDGSLGVHHVDSFWIRKWCVLYFIIFLIYRPSSSWTHVVSLPLSPPPKFCHCGVRRRRWLPRRPQRRKWISIHILLFWQLEEGEYWSDILIIPSGEWIRCI